MIATDTIFGKKASSEVITPSLIDDATVNKSFYFGGYVYKCNDLRFNPDGTKLLHFGIICWMINLSTPYDISTASYSGERYDQRGTGGSGHGNFCTYNSNGTKLIIDGYSNRKLYEFNLPTAYRLLSVSYTGKSYDYSALMISNEQIAAGDFIEGGSRLILTTTASRLLYFTLAVPYDISTISYQKEFDFSAFGGPILKLKIHEDIGKYYVSKPQSFNIREYQLTNIDNLDRSVETGVMVSPADYGNSSILIANQTPYLGVEYSSNKTIYQYTLP